MIISFFRTSRKWDSSPGRDEIDQQSITLIFWLSEAQIEFHILYCQRILPFPLAASHLPLSMAEIRVPSSLESAKEKLKQNGFPFEDLPKHVIDPAWEDVRTDCGLLLPELIALKNKFAGTTPKSVHAISLFD